MKLTPGDNSSKNMSDWPAVESTFGRGRKEWNLLIRRPFYLCLRLGSVQNALWIGKEPKTVFNRFPLRKA